MELISTAAITVSIAAILSAIIQLFASYIYQRRALETLKNAKIEYEYEFMRAVAENVRVNVELNLADHREEKVAAIREIIAQIEALGGTIEFDVEGNRLTIGKADSPTAMESEVGNE